MKVEYINVTQSKANSATALQAIQLRPNAAV
jgi:hypothetical protein